MHLINAETKTENVILITIDGLRWQEVFGGADQRLMNRENGGVRQPDTLRERFWSDDDIVRRERLLPFLWNTVAIQGQVFGDPNHESHVLVTNGHFFSYPGYNEILCGFGDPSITSNDKVPNKNITVLEWLHREPAFMGRVSAFASWDVFPFIINVKRSGIPVNAGWQPLTEFREQAVQDATNFSANEVPHYWHNVRFDVFTFRGAIECLETKQPRLLYVALGETDDWAHDGRYDLYLDAAQRNDRYIKQLWETAQALPSYAGKTSLVITTDHGRGDTRDGWKSHGVNYPGSDRIWIAIIGPDTPAKGIGRLFQLLLQVGHIGVFVDGAPSLAEPNPIDDARMVELVSEDHVFLREQRVLT